ncbi:hypothetical protein G647_08394 [Cladophialophora carrionii CBS 160.54]|uniref:Uncharacterized protein n=1 Tax=Cladophialophora carrionii CBS 160.54 TaxID=1279043 RepID=V9D0G0_9EURO|nr:uncharacterized protein G647_08394 [Cladophialophora carrionii CBS 160.54]ETI20360.1 hypothetical protein G647_08394 [Cladophialophora carrionii CBS 160.54]
MAELPLPWSITSSKRKSKSGPLTTPAARKRRRVGEALDDSKPARRKSQRTLTQAQWLNTLSPSHDEGDMQLLEEGQPRRVSAKRELGRSMKKRDSTLTQIGFFDFPPSDQQDFDETVAASPEGRAMPQMDGTHDSPRKPRTRKATPAVAVSSSKRRAAPESQEEYKPRTRKRKSEPADQEPSGSAKRRSRRVATKNEVFSDPVRNFDYFAQALATPAAVDQEENKDEPFNYPLEIKDSTEDAEDPLPDPRPVLRPSLLPETPKKSTMIVLSSQTPESLCASTRRTKRRLCETPTKAQRTPLAERSTNVPLHDTSKKAGKRGRTPKGPSPKRKVVVLKLPKRSQRRHATRIEDSQNLWSIPSSSPKPPMNPTSLPVAPVVRSTEDELEIPATSQAQETQGSPAGSQDSLPSFTNLFSVQESGGAKIDTDAHPYSSGASPQKEEGIIVRDFAGVVPRSGPRRNSTDAGHPQSPPMQVKVAPELCNLRDETANIGDEDFEQLDFGSPVANDTQFNVQVLHRVSSPLPLERASGTPKAVIDHSRPSTPTSHASGVTFIHGPESYLPDVERVGSSQSPIPVPRLVPRSSVGPDHADIELDDEDLDEVPLPRTPVLVHPASMRRTTGTQVPLNDTLNDASSPRLRPVRSNTQKSVHPASIPHPSQMSTQEPTQAFLPPSSMPQNGYDDSMGRSETFKIKDSSSSSVHLSQIPPNRTSNQPGLDLGYVLDSDDGWEGEGDLDLDPASFPIRPSQTSPPQAKPLQRRLETIPTSKGTEMTTPASTSGTRTFPPMQRHSDLENDSGPLHDSQLSPPNEVRRSEPAGKQDTSDDSHIQRSQPSDSLPSTPDKPPPPHKEYSPIAGFNNETQSNFTQNGHVTAAFIHRQREAGLYPAWFVPTPYQVPGYTRWK